MDAGSEPTILRAGVQSHQSARPLFATLNKTNTYAMCWRIQTSVKPETRKARIDKLIVMLNAEEKLYP